MISDTPLLRGLERVLDYAAARHQVIAANLANIDTPGYRTRDLRPGSLRSFAGEIAAAFAGGETAENMAPLADVSFAPVSYEVRGLLERPDGNNVSVERESLLLAQNQLRFTVAVAFLKEQFHELSSAINGGSTTS